VANVNDYLGSAFDWHETHCAPIVAGMLEGRLDDARAALAQCWELLTADQALTPDERRALEYQLHDYELGIADTVGSYEVAPTYAKVHATVAALPPVGPLSDSVQAVLLVSLAGAGTRRGFVKLAEPELDALMARIPDEHKTPNIWYYVVAWAYYNENLKYLELALEYQTVGATGWLDEYYWLRTNLMYQLVTGKATRLDVEKTLKGYPHPGVFIDFRNLFLERCERAGLMDEELYALFESQAERLERLRGTSPTATPRTVRAVKQE
jgi:hypothetical protein